MKKALALAAILAWVTSANAVVQIFFTNSNAGFGLSNPALAFDPTQGTGEDDSAYTVSAFPAAPAGEIPDIDFGAGEFAYIWGRFSGEANLTKIQGLHVDLGDTPAEVAYYIVDAGNSVGTKRWDGAYTQPNEPEFKQDPQILAAVQTEGVVNRSNTLGNWNLYNNQSRIFLLGAVRYDTAGLRSGGLGSLGLVLKIGTGSPFAGTASFGSANWIPEPASLALLGLAGLLIRRR